MELSTIRAAAARIGVPGGALRTPVHTCAHIDRLAGVSAFFKCEHLQTTGSFKFRGAMNAVGSLDEATAAHGVVAHSSGNHGAAVAAAAAARGIPCTIVVPSTTPTAKQDNITRYGANLVLCEPTQTARKETAEREAARMGGATLVHPYNDDPVIAGQAMGARLAAKSTKAPRDSGDGPPAGFVTGAERARMRKEKEEAERLSRLSEAREAERESALRASMAEAVEEEEVGGIRFNKRITPAEEQVRRGAAGRTGPSEAERILAEEEEARKVAMAAFKPRPGLYRQTTMGKELGNKANFKTAAERQAERASAVRASAAEPRASERESGRLLPEKPNEKKKEKKKGGVSWLPGGS